MLLHKLSAQKIGKVSRPGDSLKWSDTVTQMVLEVPTNNTPPSCISSDILSVAKFILPNPDVIHELSGVKFIFNFRGTISYLLMNYQEPQSSSSNRQMVQQDGRKNYKTISLGFPRKVVSNTSPSTLVLFLSMGPDKWLETASSGHSKLESRCYISGKTRMYPNWPDLLARIPQANELTISKLADGSWVMADNCNDARKYLRLLVKSINQIAEEEGISKEQIKVFEAGKVITNLYIIFFSTLTLRDRNVFTIPLFCRLLAAFTQFLVWSCHHKAWPVSAGLDEYVS